MKKIRKLIFSISAILSVFSTGSLVMATSKPLDIKKNDDINISGNVSSTKKEENEEASVNDFNKNSNILNKDTINEDNDNNKDEGFYYLNDIFKDSDYNYYNDSNLNSDSNSNISNNENQNNNQEDNNNLKYNSNSNINELNNRNIDTDYVINRNENSNNLIKDDYNTGNINFNVTNNDNMINNNDQNNNENIINNNNQNNKEKVIYKKEVIEYADGSNIENKIKATIPNFDNQKTDYFRDEDIIDTHVEENTKIY